MVLAIDVVRRSIGLRCAHIGSPLVVSVAKWDIFPRLASRQAKESREMIPKVKGKAKEKMILKEKERANTTRRARARANGMQVQLIRGHCSRNRKAVMCVETLIIELSNAQSDGRALRSPWRLVLLTLQVLMLVVVRRLRGTLLVLLTSVCSCRACSRCMRLTGMQIGSWVLMKTSRQWSILCLC